MNYILSIHFNRPAITKVHLDLLKNAYASNRFHVIFIQDHPLNPQVNSLLHDYPFPNELITREINYGLTKNILEGMKYAFSKSSHYVIILLDEIAISKDFLKFVNYCFHNFYTPDLLCITGFCESQGDYLNVENKDWYRDFGVLIPKKTFDTFILPHCTNDYYKYRDKYLFLHFPGLFKGQWNEQCGLIQRIRITSKLRILGSCVCRSMPIGIYGGRSYSPISKLPFDKKVDILSKIAADPLSVLKHQEKGPRHIQNWNYLNPEWSKLSYNNAL